MVLKPSTFGISFHSVWIPMPCRRSLASWDMALFALRANLERYQGTIGDALVDVETGYGPSVLAGLLDYGLPLVGNREAPVGLLLGADADVGPDVFTLVG